MEDFCGSGPLVQIVHVLGDYVHGIILFQRCYDFMGGIGLCVFKLAPTLVVKVQDQARIPYPAAVGGHILHVELLPEPAAVTECSKAAFCAYAGSGKHHYMLFHFSIF